ncbi:hypothetical protein BCR44DRAFT_1489139 [Catenaria anguillulae PL171]|uniref:BRCT domain-containing protein n=1 Tax=Catenaria anguillulae PL171 TaxID=765915 RepID=A0A1Y2H7W3_9FUNG|nr:hypothetical protein BCR44DRAFT_1489139 [Catenaria anguillulae PL171]
MYQAFGGHQVNDRAGHSAAGYFSMRQSKLERQFAEAAKDEDGSGKKTRGKWERQQKGNSDWRGRIRQRIHWARCKRPGNAAVDCLSWWCIQTILFHLKGTHIIAPSMSKSKIQQLLTTKSSSRRIAPIMHVVRPEWVMDSIAAGKKLKVDKYLLFRDATISKLPVKQDKLSQMKQMSLHLWPQWTHFPPAAQWQTRSASYPSASQKTIFFATIRKHQKAAPLTQQR